MASLGPYGGQHVEVGSSAGGPAGGTQAEQSSQDQEPDEAGEGDDDLGDAALLSDSGEGGAQRRPDDDACHSAEKSDDHRLGPDHGPDLPSFHPYRPQQAELVGALEHREHQGIDDPDQGDEDGQGQQDVDQPEEQVDRGLLRMFELGPGLDPTLG